MMMAQNHLFISCQCHSNVTAPPPRVGSRPGDDRTWSRTDGPLMVHGIMHAPLAVASAGTAVASAGADARGDQIGNKIGKMRLGHFVHAFEFLPCQ